MAIRKYTLQSSSPAPVLRIDYPSHLNAEQLAVVEAPAGPALVIAGAGSGKTRTLTYRVARLLETGTPPEAILLLTFTNKAAREMLKRVAELCGTLADVRRIAGGTFHHVAFAILREHASALGYGESFTLIDREDARDLMSACVADLGLSAGPRRFPKAEVMVDIVSTAVNTERSFEEVVADKRPQFVALSEKIAKVANRYAERKQQMQVMDFDDLLLCWKLLLSERPEVRTRLQERFRAILVDEYQDTNRLQGDIVDLLAAGHRNLTVVGDDAQSIYSFRGADFTNIIEFPARYPGCGVYRLTENYRSTPEILALANESIANNRRQFQKELFSRRPSGPRPALVPLRDVFQQAEFIAQRILELRDEGIPLKEQAVLYRAHHHSMEIQLELSRRGIPFIVRSGVRFLEQAHIKDVLAYLKFVHNPMDELALKRVLKLYPGIGGGIADDVWTALVRLGETTSPLQALERPEVLLELPKKAHAGYGRAAETLLEIAQPKYQGAPGEMILKVLEGGYEDYLRAEYLNGEVRADDIRQMAEYAGGFQTVHEFLSEVTLLAEFQAEDVVEGAEPDEYVTLSSVHQSKGLEWRAIFVAWLADGRFPLAAALRHPDEEEEERRLFYVAATRARDELWLTYPMTHSSRDDERTL
ncbi:MAG TPA: ATP-dependent DNA helicase, partial [Myxococcales bacterium]|nr:ATP-dependent DNA helicase [Myxococcales bacterium]